MNLARRHSTMTVMAVLTVLAVLVGCASQPRRPATRPVTTPAAASRPSTPRPAPAPASTAAGRFGRYPVGQQQLTFTEPAHTTRAGQPIGPRALLTQVWYPLVSGRAGPLPLLMFAPGFLQCTEAYSDLLRAWAGAGYVVAAVNFPRTSCQAGAGAYEPDLVNQPADVSYVLTELLAQSAQPHGVLAGRLNPGEIAAAGQSDGGDTVAALAANSCCVDHRLKAVAVLSGAEWPMPGRYFTVTSPPALFVQGDADTINPPWMSLQLYRGDDDGTRYYLDLLGASHLVPYEGTDPVEQVVARVTLAFFDRYVLGQIGAAETMIHDGNVSGTAALVSGGHSPP